MSGMLIIAGGGKGQPKPNTLCVPLSALAEDDGTQPAVGDSVDIDAQGKVVNIDGDNATVEIDQANGAAPVQPGKSDEDDSSANDDEGQSLRDELGKEDDSNGY